MSVKDTMSIINDSFHFLVGHKLPAYCHANFVLWHSLCTGFIAAFMRREDFLSSSYIQRLFMESTPFLEENKPEKLNKILAFEICLELVSIQLRDFP